MAHASGANWGTSPNGSTFTENIGSVTRLATSAPFSRYLTEQIVATSALIQSGLIQTDARLTTSRVFWPSWFSISWTTQKRTLTLLRHGALRAMALTTQKHTAST